MRVLKRAYRSLLWARSQLTAKGVMTVGLWSAALISVVMAFAVRDANRSVERQADATASRLAAAVEQDIARNVELLDLVFGRSQPLFKPPQSQIQPFWTVFRATGPSISSRW